MRSSMTTQLQRAEVEIFGEAISAEEQAENHNRRENHHCITPLRPSRASITRVAAPLLFPRIPIIEGPPGRRRVVWVWVCCICGYGGMKISVDPCPNCCNPRCPNCDTRRINTRSHQ
ncbi:uncharacterized protein B0J16DRAFT_3882 [Fusarium flagelliforme]|uniref:uncharacterized protein n=1 Tax=Fusarium flagelliforme TaxID=2675880 RepID=UPI001E8D1D90|nr:uncharacterized protein B0J16DRAFT_3882 [Fusarium flagelliforme]KAH7196661.1 hypothetical protein B0J16DRAFT_3882 [Fusarium flagelliforme]